MSARKDLYAAVMAGGTHSPDRSERASQRIDAFRNEVVAERDMEIVRWLGKKARKDGHRDCMTCRDLRNASLPLGG